MKNFTRSLILTVFVWAAGNCFAGTISARPSATIVQVGDSFSLEIDISDVVDLFAFQFDLSFDPAFLDLRGATESGFFGTNGVSFFPGIIDNMAGADAFIADSLSGTGPGFSGNDILVSVLLTAIGAGSTSVGLSNVTLLNSTLSEISSSTIGASITIVPSQTTIPEPSTWILVSTGLAAMFWFRHGNRSRRVLKTVNQDSNGLLGPEDSPS